MKQVIFIFAVLFSLSVNAQRSVVHDFITAKQELTVGDSATSTGNVGIATKNPTQKLDVNGGLRVRSLVAGIVVSNASGVLSIDSTLTADSLRVNVLTANNVRVNRDSFTDPAASIASIGDSGFVVQCAANCDDIRWTTIDGLQTVLKDSTDNVGIGTSAPLSKLDVRGSFIVDSSNVKLEFGKNKGLLLMDGLSYNQATSTSTGLRFNLGYSNDISAYLIELNLTNLGESASVGMQDNGTLNLQGTANINMGTELFNLSIDGTEAAGYVLTSDASGNATWQDPNAYGEMGFGDSSRLIALTQNVFSVVTNSNNTLWSPHATTLHNVTYAGDSLVVDSGGVFKIDLMLSLLGTTSTVIKLGIFVNGVLILPTQQLELRNAQIDQIQYMRFATLTAGDVVKVVVTNATDNDDITVVSGTILINRID